jgi:hypothetical protein
MPVPIASLLEKTVIIMAAYIVYTNYRIDSDPGIDTFYVERRGLLMSVVHSPRCYHSHIFDSGTCTFSPLSCLEPAVYISTSYWPS